MKNWDDVLQHAEIKQRQLMSLVPHTVVGGMHDQLISSMSKRQRLQHSERKYYYLGQQFPNIYFTRREAECMVLMLQGYTLVGVAKHLNLSVRTIEFYVKNMKIKLAVDSKMELIQLVLKTDFLTKLQSCMTAK